MDPAIADREHSPAPAGRAWPRKAGERRLGTDCARWLAEGRGSEVSAETGEAHRRNSGVTSGRNVEFAPGRAAEQNGNLHGVLKCP